MNNLDYENRNAFMPPLQTIKKKHISLITKIKNIFQPGGVTYGKLLRQISKQDE